MATINAQQLLSKVRPPRVQITYDVQVGDAERTIQLPLVIGVLGDFSGMPANPLPPLKEREFTEITGANFNQVLAGMNPRLLLQVQNTLDGKGDLLGVELSFNTLEDFHPVNVINQVPSLQALFMARQRLSDLLGQIDGNQQLDALLDTVLSTPSMQSDLQKALAAPTAAAPAAEASEAPPPPPPSTDPKPKQS